ncbi:MAG: hypothetical protein HXO42_10665 [Prevotella sp.]|uniref:hypothetical protein n=1 Tax=Prevotella sp. TaxID=59823 RepID=UPI001CB2F45F|nr:hypothetical protein [Prevotella sp.]MBF1620920.1 hypothetical protein [Prevotella sp.]
MLRAWEQHTAKYFREQQHGSIGGKLGCELFEFYHHGVIHNPPIAFLFQEGKFTPCMGIDLCLAHAVLAFHRAVGAHGLYLVLLPICRHK